MLKAKKLAELYEIAEQIGIENLKGLKKQQVIDKILDSTKEKKSDELNTLIPMQVSEIPIDKTT